MTDKRTPNHYVILIGDLRYQTITTLSKREFSERYGIPIRDIRRGAMMTDPWFDERMTTPKPEGQGDEVEVRGSSDEPAGGGE